MATHLKLIAPKKRTVGRKPNSELRTREHLTANEVETLIEAAKGNRQGHRDATMILSPNAGAGLVQAPRE
jgi:hypothetical protein